MANNAAKTTIFLFWNLYTILLLWSREGNFWLIDMRRTLFIESSITDSLRISIQLMPYKNYLVCLTFSPNGSNDTVIRLTPFKLSNLTFLAIAENIPPDLLSDPVIGRDIVVSLFILSKINFFG